MYLREVRIQNVRSIDDIDWECPKNREPGWHVIIGDNGSGKSTFLRSIALALVGPSEAIALRQDWDEWLTRGQDRGYVRLDLVYQGQFDKFSGSGASITRFLLPVKINFTRHENEVKVGTQNVSFNPNRYVWGGKPGWFSAAYGPFRRFAGGDKDYEKIFYSNPRLAAHLSVFGENVALSECIRWLQDLQFKKLENQADGNLLDHIRNFVNQEGFLPHQARLSEVSSRGVDFIDGNGYTLPVEDLSDGYRSILSMTFELIRQMAKVYEPHQIFNPEFGGNIGVPGVVLIDEVDAHLHPSWQRGIGVWFREHFPKMQFIVTTHSPLICQAAEVGTVWRLPRPGSEEKGGRVVGPELDRLIYGNILDAYSTEMFGDGASRSAESIKLLERLAELNQKELTEALSEAEKSEQQQLRSILPTAAHTTLAPNVEL
jgi:energy-coupling factor transporter ATP-binding protein EcfA2